MKYLILLALLTGCVTKTAKSVGEELQILADRYHKEEISGDELASEVGDMARLIKFRIFVEGE